jgi:hypothetical protein
MTDRIIDFLMIEWDGITLRRKLRWRYVGDVGESQREFPEHLDRLVLAAILQETFAGDVVLDAMGRLVVKCALTPATATISQLVDGFPVRMEWHGVENGQDSKWEPLPEHARKVLDAAQARIAELLKENEELRSHIRGMREVNW